MFPIVWFLVLNIGYFALGIGFLVQEDCQLESSRIRNVDEHTVDGRNVAKMLTHLFETSFEGNLFSAFPGKD